MAHRPTLAVPQPRADDYLAYWGDTQYTSFCNALGLPHLRYSEFVAQTIEKGPLWWEKAIQLSDITRLPSVEDYRLLLASSHPEEFSGPRRYFHYIRLYKGDRKNLLHQLGGVPNTAWYESAMCL